MRRSFTNSGQSILRSRLCRGRSPRHMCGARHANQTEGADHARPDQGPASRHVDGRDARQNNDFFTHKLGLRRVKKTVNFDAPDVYHLYYADEFGTPGSVMTYFPFPNIGKGRHGVGEVGTTVFSVPEGTLAYWQERLADEGVTGHQARDGVRREAPGLRRAGRRRFCAGRGQGRQPRAVDAWRRARRRGDPRLPFGYAAG